MSRSLLLFCAAAIALLGSPGPAIAALIALGRSSGFAASLPFFIGLQVGLALAAALTAAGFLTLLAAVPAVLQILSVVGTLYLVYLAYKIATSPVGLENNLKSNAVGSATAGFTLGITNPKAYLVFASLIASYTLVLDHGFSDAALKWLILVAVMIVVDLIWLYIGAWLRRFKFSERGERIMNVVLGGSVLFAAVMSHF